MIEAEVHQQLRAFLREQREPHWAHHLTMARLVARALRLGRSALIQTGTTTGFPAPYRLSYLLPLLLWKGPVLLVTPERLHQPLLRIELPRLQQWIAQPKPIQVGDRWPQGTFEGILLTTPESWLRDRFYHEGRFPQGISTVMDGVDDLETWTRQVLTSHLPATEWDSLMLAIPSQMDAIRDIRVGLTRAIFHRPANPYECYLMDDPERSLLQDLHQLAKGSQAMVPPVWQLLFEQLQQSHRLTWATIHRSQGTFSLHSSPTEVGSFLDPLWLTQPTVLIGSALDLETEATIYRQTVGLGDLTCLKFSPDRQDEIVQLYQPDGMPMPNTPQFQTSLLKELRYLLSHAPQGPAVVLVGDTPLRSQVGSVLAAEFGSRVQVERTSLDEYSILVCGWEFWQTHQQALPTPTCIAIATLPIPSLEHPLVAGRVNYYKKNRQDWFRLYLLPTALMELQRAISPIRDAQGLVALLDSRVLHRSYGQQVLAALSPFARISYLETPWDEDTLGA